MFCCHRIEVKMNELKFLKSIWRDFSERSVYSLIAIARKKDNRDITNSREIVLREIVKSEDKILEKLDSIYYRISAFNGMYNFRIYASVNARDIIKAAKELSYEILTRLIDYKEDINKLHKLKRIDNIWFSVLNKPENVYKNRFVILDIDHFDYDKYNETVTDTVIALERKIVADGVGKMAPPIIRKTHSGVHLIFEKTFKIELLRSFFMESLQYQTNKKIEFDVLKDSVTFIEYIAKTN